MTAVPIMIKRVKRASKVKSKMTTKPMMLTALTQNLMTKRKKRSQRKAKN